MEDINNTNNSTTPIISEVPNISNQSPKSNIFKYLFIISIIILLVVIISFIFILKNTNSETSLTQQNNNDISQTTPTTTITPTLEEELYPFINPEKNPDTIFKINKSEGNFANVNIGSRSGSGVATIWEKESGIWKEIMGTQEFWDCEKIMKEDVPPILINNECYYYNTQETWKYNTDLKKWEKTTKVFPG